MKDVWIDKDMPPKVITFDNECYKTLDLNPFPHPPPMPMQPDPSSLLLLQGAVIFRRR